MPLHRQQLISSLRSQRKLLREDWPELLRQMADSRIVCFTTYDGTVLAASNWDESPEIKTVRPGMDNSYEELFHEAGGDFWLPLRVGAESRELLLQAGKKLERAIGVIYRPETERQSHYFYAQQPEQFDAVIHIDRTSALVPLDPPVPMPGREVPETYPTAV